MMSNLKIPNIEIKNFKCFEEFSIDNFKQFNLIFGNNSVGKSALLESLFLYSCMDSTYRFINIFYHRDLIFDNDLSVVFYNFDYKNNINIKTNNNELNIFAIESLNKDSLDGIYYNVTFDNKKYKLPLLINTNRQLDDSFANFNLKDNNNILATILNNQSDMMFNCFLINNLFMSNDITKKIVLKKFNNMQNEKKDEYIVNTLKTIIPEIQSIKIFSNNTIKADIGLKKYLHINSLGEGILKIFNYLVIAFGSENGVLLIDEIDNGFHHTSLRKLWTALFDICSKNNIQLFATTHSYECINAFNDIYKENKDKYNSDNDIQGIRINADKNEKGKYKAVIYDEKSLDNAMDNWEVR